MYRFFGIMGFFLAVLAALLTWFYHGFLKRARMAFFHGEFFPRDAASIAVIGGKPPRHKRLLGWLLSLLLALLSLNVMHISGIYLLHMAAIGALLHLLYLLFKSFLPAALRRIHFSGVIPVLAALLVLVFGFLNLHHVTPTRYTLYTDKPIRQGGVRAVVISDVHYGVSLDDDEMQQVCDEISALAPDAVLLLGDIVDNDTPAASVPVLFSMLGGIEAKEGVYFVFGNHDRPYTQAKSEFDKSAVLAAIQNAGITLLQDETALLGDDVLLIGREDASRSRMPIDALLPDDGSNRYRIVLDHQPADYENIGKTDADLVLSGHTHGGQLFPLGQLMSLFHINDHVYGYTEIDADTAAIVSSGLALWRFPVKTAAPAEYCIIDILPR